MSLETTHFHSKPVSRDQPHTVMFSVQVTVVGSLTIVCIQLGPPKLSVIRSSGVSAFQGLLIEVNGRTVKRIGCYIMGVGCPLSGILL